MFSAQLSVFSTKKIACFVEEKRQKLCFQLNEVFKVTKKCFEHKSVFSVQKHIFSAKTVFSVLRKNKHNFQRGDKRINSSKSTQTVSLLVRAVRQSYTERVFQGGSDRLLWFLFLLRNFSSKLWKCKSCNATGAGGKKRQTQPNFWHLTSAFFVCFCLFLHWTGTCTSCATSTWTARTTPRPPSRCCCTPSCSRSRHKNDKKTTKTKQSPPPLTLLCCSP